MFYIREDFEDNNIHEILKKDINASEFDIKELKSKDLIDQYIILDSYIKLKNSATEHGEFQWVFNTSGQNTNESIGVYSPIDYVTEIQIGPFNIPIIEDILYMDKKIEVLNQIQLVQNNTSAFNVPPTLVKKNPPVLGQYPLVLFTEAADNYKVPWINNPYSQIPHSDRISIYIKESSMQSYLNYNNTRFNYEFIVSYDTRLHFNPNFLQANPTSNRWDTYTFISPLRNLSTMTLVFRNPDSPISFEPDVMYSSVINLTDNGLGGKHVNIFTQYPHKLLAGDRIFLKNFNPMMADGDTPNPNFPQYIVNYINRIEGHVVNVTVPDIFPSIDPGKPIDGLSFGLDPSIMFIEPIDPNISVSFPGLVDVYIAKRRIRIPIKIKSLKNKV